MRLFDSIISFVVLSLLVLVTALLLIGHAQAQEPSPAKTAAPVTRATPEAPREPVMRARSNTTRPRPAPRAAAAPQPSTVPPIVGNTATLFGMLLGLAGAGLTYLLRAAAIYTKREEAAIMPPLGCNLCMSCWAPLGLAVAWWLFHGSPLAWFFLLWYGCSVAVGIVVARICLELIGFLSSSASR